MSEELKNGEDSESVDEEYEQKIESLFIEADTYMIKHKNYSKAVLFPSFFPY